MALLPECGFDEIEVPWQAAVFRGAHQGKNSATFGTRAGTLYALDRATGSPIWRYDTQADGSAAEFHGEPLLVGGRVIIPTDSDPKGHIYSFDAASGDLLWKVAFNQGVATTPLFIDGRVVAVSAGGEDVALDPQNGAGVSPGRTARPIKPPL